MRRKSREIVNFSRDQSHIELLAGKPYIGIIDLAHVWQSSVQPQKAVGFKSSLPTGLGLLLKLGVEVIEFFPNYVIKKE